MARKFPRIGHVCYSAETRGAYMRQVQALPAWAERLSKGCLICVSGHNNAPRSAFRDACGCRAHNG